MVTQGLVPSEVLAQIRLQAENQFDSTVQWIATGAKADLHGDRVDADPELLPARVVRKLEEFFDLNGQRNVSTARIYLPLNTPIKTSDRLIMQDDPKRLGPILEIAQVPTIGSPILLRVRTGSTGA